MLAIVASLFHYQHLPANISYVFVVDQPVDEQTKLDVVTLNGGDFSLL